MTRRAQKDPRQYTKPAVDTIKRKQKDIANHVHEDKAQVLIETDLKVVVEAFEDFINGMKGCECTGKGEVDLVSSVLKIEDILMYSDKALIFLRMVTRILSSKSLLLFKWLLRSS